MKKGIAALLIALAVVVTYAPAARDGFVWDDTALVLRDPLIRSWRLVGEGFNHFLFVDATASDFYRPLQRLTYTLEYAAFVFQPAAYHATNIVLHAAAAVALFFFAEALLQIYGIEKRRRSWVAFIAALIWAVHPIQSAAVVYVSGRADPLAALFGFAGCYFLIRDLHKKASPSLVSLVGAGVLFLLSALSKESGLIFPAVGIVLLLLTKKHAGAWKTAAVTAFVCTIYLALRFSAEHNPAPVLTKPAPLVMRPIAAARAIAEYAGLVALPVNLHMDRQLDARPALSTETDYSRFAWRELQTLLGLVLLGVVVAWAWRVRQRSPAAFACLILAALTYLPVSGVVLLNAAVAEHWIYLPSAFLFLAAVLTIMSAIEANGAAIWIRRAALAAVGCWLLFLGTRTFVRTFDWKDQRTFLLRTIAAGGDSTRMRINLGGLELSEGNLDRAKEHLQEALGREPDHPLAVINLAAVALKQDDFKTARDLLTRATKMPVVDAQALELLAVLDHREGKEVNPLRLRQASRTGPPDWSIEKRYIQFMNESGATEAAIKELETCLQTQWYRAESWQLLHELFTKFGRTKEAGWALQQANAYDVHLDNHKNFL